MAASYFRSGNLSTKPTFHCQDEDCYILPSDVAAGRLKRFPDLVAEPVLLYTPLDLDDGADWVAAALAPRPSRALGQVAIRAEATSIELGDGRALTSILGPIGAPSTVATLELAIALGARQILFFGICGSLHADLAIGDIVLVDSAVREEGTSFHYLPPDAPALASSSLLAAAEAVLSAAGEPFHRGPIWTTDAPYRETRTKVARLANEGVLGVEMETSAVYALAQYRGVEALSVQIVSDQLVGEKWTGITRATFRARCDRAIQLLAELARSAPAPDA